MTVDISYSATWGNLGLHLPARVFVEQELKMLVMAEELCFDAAWSPEHHFDANYAACPDNALALSYVAAKTSVIKLGLGAVILPWNDPVRVVEKLSMLDHASGGRLLIGFGRGLAKMEYAGFGLDMNDSRDQFNESIEMVLRGIRTGIVEGDGPHYRQARVEIHPAPDPALADRLYCVGMSPDSAVRAGELGATLLTFVTSPDEQMKPLIDAYRDTYLARHGRTAPPEILVDFALVHEDRNEAERLGRKYAGRYYESVVSHYNFDGTHFGTTRGYEAYADGAKAIRDAGLEAATDAYVAPQAAIGTPEQVLAKFRRRYEVLGRTNVMATFLYGAMPYEVAEQSIRLFADAVMPELRKMAAQSDESMADQLA
ncbi:LLM class flavin-dependent oxidoreductase [Nocardia jiangxiensis]|uniref:LLM class flavin-dependent oxidoreductase n=1 Tax=Nocardia jiangxiensis TaxID=282685 RepID=UPI00146EEF13|nr:LLM class flavin-dependent oxidoreductase [Nocardia jiangxiensis]